MLSASHIDHVLRVFTFTAVLFRESRAAARCLSSVLPIFFHSLPSKENIEIERGVPVSHFPIARTTEADYTRRVNRTENINRTEMLSFQISNHSFTQCKTSTRVSLRITSLTTCRIPTLYPRYNLFNARYDDRAFDSPFSQGKK